MKKMPIVETHSHGDYDTTGDSLLGDHHENHETGGLDAIAALAGEVITSGTVDGDRLPAISTTKKGAVPAVTPATPSEFLRDTGDFEHIVQADCGGLETTATPEFSGLGINVPGAENSAELAEGATIGDATGPRIKYNKAAALIEVLDADLNVGNTPTIPGTGGTWSTSYDSAGTKIHCVAEFEGKLYAGSEEGIIYVYDGSSWTPAFDATPASKITALCVFGSKLYACGWQSSGGTITTVYSTADGVNWPTVWSNNWGYIVEGIQSMAVHDNKLYVGLTQSGVYYSSDGAAFSSSSFAAGYGAAGLCVFNGSLYAVANNMASGATKIYKLVSGSWSAVYTDAAGIDLNCIYTWNGKLYVGATAGKIYASADGATWGEVEDLGSMGVLCLREYAGLLLAGCNNGTVYQSADGLAWASFYASGEAAVYGILEYGGSLYAATGSAGKVNVYTDNTYVPAPNETVYGHLTVHGQFRPGDAPGVEGDILLSGGAAHATWLARGATGQYVGGVTGGKPILKVIPASDVTVGPTSTLEATDVQAAIEELEDEKLSTSSLTAIAVPFAPSSAIDASNVQDAIEEVEAEKAAAPIIKLDTGDPVSGEEGQLCVNTYNNNVKIYADGSWRSLATW